MKFTRSIVAILALLIALCIAFTGCNRDNESNNDDGGFSPSISAPDNSSVNDGANESVSPDIDDADDGEADEDDGEADEDDGEDADSEDSESDADGGNDNGDATDGSGDATDNGGNGEDGDPSPYYDPICDILGIPYYSGDPWVAVNGNQPTFTEDEITTVGYEFFSELDELGRCGYVMACVGQEMMPTEDRGDIGHIKPTGWVQNQYDGNLVSGGSLYNRSHLIGFQLTGENDNRQNLITGTRYMNWDGMVSFENMIADYVKETDNHVMYRVTPMFYENELLARGVHMEAYSVEDNGEGICFNVYAYNVQPGIAIDYATGENWLASEGENPDGDATDAPEDTNAPKYILNTSSKKVHIPTCSSVSQMSDKNKQEYNGELEDILAQGYDKCGACKAGT